MASDDKRMEVTLDDGTRIESPHAVPEEEDNATNVDIWVTLPSGEKFVGTVYTCQNIEALMAKNRQTGEVPQFYHWDVSFVVTDVISRDRLKSLVIEMRDTGDLADAFQKVE